MWLPNCDVYVVDNGEREVLIPVVTEVVRKVNYENEYIMITPMDGLLD
jgi:ribosomal 30S subunit maturation factor RimM